MNILRRRLWFTLAAGACLTAFLAAGCGNDAAPDRVGVLERQITDVGVGNAAPGETRCREQRSALRYACTLQERTSGRRFTLQVVVAENGSWTTSVERANAGAEFTTGLGVSGCCLPTE